MERITEDTTIDALLDACPEANGYMIECGLPCMVCGEPFWGTVGQLAGRHGIDDLDGLLAGLNALLNGGEADE